MLINSGHNFFKSITKRSSITLIDRFWVMGMGRNSMLGFRLFVWNLKHITKLCKIVLRGQKMLWKNVMKLKKKFRTAEFAFWETVFFFLQERREASIALRNNQHVSAEAVSDCRLIFSLHVVEKPEELTRRSLTVMAPVKLPLLSGKISHLEGERIEISFIPGLSRAEREIVQLWRFGTRDKMFELVRLFEKGWNRKQLVSNYRNSA